MSACPCGTTKKYEDCCEPYLSGRKHAPTAEALMRSRYTAYVKHKIEYVGATHDPAGPNDFDAEAAHNWAVNTEWKGLEIVQTGDGGPQDSEGMVEFVARFRTGEQDLEHHEMSFFRRDAEAGRWYYVDGKTVRKPMTRSAPKVGRNDPCPCGSGKKHKKCCAA